MRQIVPTVDDLASPSSKDDEVCALCKKTFKGNSALKRHLRISHKPNEEEKFYCPIENCCHSLKRSNPFLSFVAIKQHYQLVHGSSHFKCQRCNRSFKTKHNCKKHEAECGVKYVCSCDVYYTTKRGLFDHIERTKHTLPEKLRALFASQSNNKKKVKASKPPILPKSKNHILPKTLKSKVRLFRLTPTAVNTRSTLFDNIPPPIQQHSTTPFNSIPPIQQHSTTPFNSIPPTVQINVNDNAVQTISPGETVVLCAATVGKRSFATQFPQTDLPGLDRQLTANTLDAGSDASWPQRNISIQTDQSFTCNSWMTDSDISKMLSENIGTQTTESVYDRSFGGRYSTLSQTDICFDIDQDMPVPPLWEQNQPVILCDAQNQTPSDYLHLPTCSATEQEFAATSNTGFEVSTTQTIPDIFSNIHSSIETQTDTSINLLSTQTQTLNSFDFQQQTDFETGIGFDELNNIQTQTDFFLPSLAPSPSMFVHNYTQTSEPDILDKILTLD